ncbi:nucleotide binding protein, putative [Ricinus communis]|uniref:Nucleotide binding protein, putative n=1 Tax=Ricinus communis TaxID=3988 RepID=B9SPN4_RICCO|nr:nucleotide binding protein, putative [Ricinus communis]
MAAGTMAGAVDLSFSSSATLEIFKLDFQSEDHDLPFIGEFQSSERFNRLAWGKNGSGSDQYSLGLIAGGLVDGSIDIWNPLSLIRCGKFIIYNAIYHIAVVLALFISLNFLWQISFFCSWFLFSFSSLTASGSAAQGEISYISWNSKVQHILASTSFNGITGVIAMSWCPNDSSYLLTCAKDNRTICWNTITGEIVRELPAGSNWNFDVHWYSKIPGVITASSFDGKIGIYNIEGCSQYVAGESDLGAATLRAPKWYKRPAGVSFGFGGKLVSFHPKSSTANFFAILCQVLLHNLVTEHGLVSRSSEFESAIQNGEKSSLKALCERKSQESESEDDRETWGFLMVMFEEDGTARTKMLSHLGFSVPVEEKDALQDDISEQIDAVRLDDTATDKVGYESVREATVFSADDGEDFFNNLPSPKADTPHKSSDNFGTGNSVPQAEEPKLEPDGVEESSDPSFDDSIQRALVVGDYKGAVAQCISANKMADALVIAHVGGTSLWESTRDQYLKMSRSPYLKIVSAMVNNDLMSLVNTRPLKYWKETLALLCTFAQNEEWSLLCNSLASKLMAVGNTLAATLCFICAGNIDKTVEIWSRNLTSEHEGKSYVELLQDLMEKTIVLALASGQKRFSASLCKLVEKYAEILASQGLLTTAMEYLKLLGSDELSPELIILRDRIALSTEPEKDAKTTTFGISQQPSGSMYGAEQSSYGLADSSQNYYQETPTSQVHQSIPGSPYSENYQQSLGPSYGRTYGAPAPYQPAPQPAPYQPAAQPAPYQPAPQPAPYQPTPYQPASQPGMFIPSQAPQVPQASFAPPNAATQQAVRTFVPSDVPILRNAEQYQQPTLGSQLYPGAANPTYQPVQPPAGSQGPITSQVGPIPGHKPQVVAPASTPMGFRPLTNSGVRPAIGSMQPPSPTQSAIVQPAVAPAAPPTTVQTVDTSNVPAHHRPVITTLTRLFNETSEALGGSRANPARKREIEDNSRKIGALFAKLNSGDISKNASDKLVQLCQALDKNDFSTALQIQVLLTTSEWDECNFWLATLKRMIKTRQGAGVRSS